MEDEHGNSALTDFESAKPPQGGDEVERFARWVSWAIAAITCVASFVGLVAWVLHHFGDSHAAGLAVWFIGPWYLGAGPLVLRSVMKRRGFDQAARERFERWSSTKLLRRRLEDLRRQVVSSIAEAPNGVVRIRGRVRVLSAIDGPSEEAVVARAGAIGRFAIVDESGIAVVDDDMVELWPTDVNTLGSVHLRAGDLVEVVGRAKAGYAKEAAGGAYRGGHNALVFDGTPDEKIHVIKLAYGAVPTKVRVAATPPDVHEEALESASGGRETRR